MSKDHQPVSLPRHLDGFNPTVLLLDDFEGSNTWTVTGNAGNYSLTFTTTAAFNQLQGGLLATRSVAPANADFVTATRHCGWTPHPALRLSLLLATVNAAQSRDITITLSYSTGPRNYSPFLRWEPPAGKVYYGDDSYLPVELADLSFTAPDHTWVGFSLTIDQTTHQYRYAAVNGRRHSLAGLPYYSTIGAGYRSVSPNIRLRTNSANQAQLYLDSFQLIEETEP